MRQTFWLLQSAARTTLVTLSTMPTVMALASTALALTTGVMACWLKPRTPRT